MKVDHGESRSCHRGPIPPLQVDQGESRSWVVGPRSLGPVAPESRPGALGPWDHGESLKGQPAANRNLQSHPAAPWSPGAQGLHGPHGAPGLGHLGDTESQRRIKRQTRETSWSCVEERAFLQQYAVSSLALAALCCSFMQQSWSAICWIYSSDFVESSRFSWVVATPRIHQCTEVKGISHPNNV